MGYNILDHTADLALEVYADRAEMLFNDLLLGWQTLLFGRAVSGEQISRHSLRLQSDCLVNLSVVFLQEVQYLYECKQQITWRCSSIVLQQVTEGWDGEFMIECIADPDSLIPAKYEIKAVTFHHPLLKQIMHPFHFIIVFDI